MIDPALALQGALRAALVASPALDALVPADHIRAGAIRPERLPSVVFADAQVEFLGCAAGSQRLARVFLTLHIWAQEDGADTARAIGAAVYQALEFGPLDTPEIAVDEWTPPRLVWLRDPKPELSLTHGVMTLEAVVRWRV
jgi:hypothetical protein